MAASLHLPADVESQTPEQILTLLLEEFPGRVALACSFQKEESVLLEMLFALEPKARVFAIDTHHLFPETYAYRREVEERYGTTIEVFEGPSPDEIGSGRRSPISTSRSRRSSRSSAPSAVSTPGSPGFAATSRRHAPARRRSAGTSSTSCGR